MEIRTALTQLKNAKALGADNITSEALGGPCAAEALHRILNFVPEKVEIPDDWKRDLPVKLPERQLEGNNVTIRTQLSLNSGRIEPNDGGC